MLFLLVAILSVYNFINYRHFLCETLFSLLTSGPLHSDLVCCESLLIFVLFHFFYVSWCQEVFLRAVGLVVLRLDEKSIHRLFKTFDVENRFSF